MSPLVAAMFSLLFNRAAIPFSNKINKLRFRDNMGSSKQKTKIKQTEVRLYMLQLEQN